MAVGGRRPSPHHECGRETRGQLHEGPTLTRLGYDGLFDASLFHAREYHNTSRAVRQTSRKPREDCESDTTPVSPFRRN